MRKGISAIEIFVVIVIIVVLGLLVFVSMGSSNSTSTASTTQNTVNIPAPTNYLVDEAGALTPDQDNAIDAELQAFDTNSSGTAQIGVLIVTSTQPETIEQYTQAVFASWKVGYKGSNNGVLFVLATVDRNARIQTGEGFEGTLPDVTAEQDLQTYAVPYFAKSDWFDGVSSTVAELVSQLSSK